MTNEHTTDDAPAFNLQRIYVKDISFENPNSPEVFVDANKPPKVEMSLDLKHRQINAENWEVSLKMGAVVRVQENETLLFEIEVEHAGLFLMQNIPDEHMPMLLEVECPTIIYPYMRQIVSQLSIDGSYVPFTLEPVNFRALYEQKQQQAAEQASATIQ